MVAMPGTRTRLLLVGVAAAVTLPLVSCSAAADDPSTSPTPSPVPHEQQGVPPAAEKDLANLPSDSPITARRYQYDVSGGGGDPKQNWMDLYLPAHADNDATPLVILIHGGAWLSHIGADSFEQFSRHLAERGLAVLNVEYRRVGSGGGWPTTFTDVAAALDSVPAINRQIPQLDHRNAVVVGHSAGGQLAMWAGTRHRLDGDEVGANPKFRPTHVISLAGPLDMRKAVTLGDDRIVRVMGGTPEEVPERYTSVDPIQNIDPDTPVVAAAGTDDKVVPPVLAGDYVRAVKRSGGDAYSVLMPGENHVSIVDSRTDAFRQVVELITREANDAHQEA
jgi:acetyl esterase/lipase